MQSRQLGSQLSSLLGIGRFHCARHRAGKGLEAWLDQCESRCRHFLMVSTRDFAEEAGSQDRNFAIQGRSAGPQGIDRGRDWTASKAGRRAFHGRLQGCRRQDCSAATGLSCRTASIPMKKSRKSKISRASRLPYPLPIQCPICWRARRWQNSASLTSEVKLAAVGGDKDRYQALIGGVVDAAVVLNEYQPVAPKSIHLLVAGREAVPNFLRVCMVSSAKTLAERGDDAVKFLAAEMAALRLRAGEPG